MKEALYKIGRFALWAVGYALGACLLSWVLFKCQIANIDPAVLFVGLCVLDLAFVAEDNR